MMEGIPADDNFCPTCGHPRTEQREKEWQVLAGEFASLANWAAIMLCGRKKPTSNDIDQAHEIIDRVGEYLVFDERY